MPALINQSVLPFSLPLSLSLSSDGTEHRRVAGSRVAIRVEFRGITRGPTGGEATAPSVYRYEITPIKWQKYSVHIGAYWPTNLHHNARER